MTNEKLIDRFKVDPTVNARSSYFRVMDGMMFIKDPDPWDRVKGWRPVFIISEVVLFITPPWGFLPERGANKVSSALNEAESYFKNESTVITLDAQTDIPNSLYQKPNLRGVPNRQCYIRDIMKTVMRHEPTYFSRNCNDIIDGDRESFVDESYKISWEYAITSAASEYTKAKKKLEVEVNMLVSCAYVSDVSSGVDELRKQVMRDDLSSAEESYRELGLCVKKLQEVMGRAYGGIQNAKRASGVIHFQAVTWFDDIPPEKFTPSNAGRYIFSILNPNIIEGWVDFSKFLTNLGIDIPRPFGEDLSLESVRRLAAFHDVSAESYYNFKAYFLGLKEDQAKTTETCNLYLG